jgi:2-polyprenyl-3-methyl-5-hydroxy-6-metoxy-1,4-benzoquinol methylase
VFAWREQRDVLVRAVPIGRPFSAVHAVRDCPLCGGREARMIWIEAGYSYVRCRSCGAIFSDLRELDYERVRHNVWNDEAPDADALEFYGAARELVHRRFLERYPPSGEGRLLDIGCGLGFFLERARGEGWDVQGIDTSEAWVRLANARLGAELVQCETLDRADLPAASFDLITAWDVLEHIFHPVRFLAQARRLLARGGRLFIRTPNIAYGYPVYAARRWLLGHNVELGPTNHVVYFTAATMRRALSLADLAPVDWPVLVPPQVALAPRPGARLGTGQQLLIAAKNAYATTADAIAGASRGRIVIGSDLDVLTRAA